MKNIFRKDAWNPYIAGVLVGILAICSVIISTKILGTPKYLGASTTFVRTAGLIEKSLVDKHVVNNEYFQAKKVKIDWQMMFVIGIFCGAFISSILGKTYRSEKVPPIWKENYGNKISIRALWAFVGGMVAILGARLAGGCPSGHGLSGVMQLAVSSLIAMVFFVVGGIVTAKLIYRK